MDWPDIDLKGEINRLHNTLALHTCVLKPLADFNANFAVKYVVVFMFDTGPQGVNRQNV